MQTLIKNFFIFANTYATIIQPPRCGFGEKVPRARYCALLTLYAMNVPILKKGDDEVDILVTVTTVRTTKGGDYVIVKGYDKDECIHKLFISLATADSPRELPSNGQRVIANYKYYEKENRTYCWCE